MNLLKTLPIALIAALSSLSAWGGESLTIAAGETFTVSPDMSRLMLDSLTIGDGATIRFAEGVDRWQLRAQQARIGSGVVVDGSGADGRDGGDGKGHSRAAASCVSGQPGADGGAGGDGTNGVNMRIQLGLVQFGGLTVRSGGGDGGNGGAGGKGQDAGEFGSACKSAPSGGDAGKGGDGGNGGDAGDVTFMYWPASTAVKGVDVASLIKVEAEPGLAGAAGKSGKPGAGSEGRYIQKRTLAGDRAWLAGGDMGEKGGPGQSGHNGLQGDTLIEQALMTAQPVAVETVQQPASAPAAEKPASEQEIRELKDTLKALMKRLDELESKE